MKNNKIKLIKKEKNETLNPQVAKKSQFFKEKTLKHITNNNQYIA